MWCSDSVLLSGQGGVRLAPRPRHTKDNKNNTHCCSVQRQTYKKVVESHFLLTLEPPGHVLRSQLGWLPLGTWPLDR
jgi:hypothetical protein